MLDAGAPVEFPEQVYIAGERSEGFYSTHTPLLLAAAVSMPEVIRLLIDRGANLEAEEFDRSTPLMNAARSRKSENAMALLGLGACTDLPPDSGSTRLLPCAIQSGLPDLVRRLVRGIPLKPCHETAAIRR